MEKWTSNDLYIIENLGKLTILESTVLQTVGIKGYDGFALSVVK